MLNLIRNASEALSHAGRQDGRIVIEATAEPEGNDHDASDGQRPGP